MPNMLGPKNVSKMKFFVTAACPDTCSDADRSRCSTLACFSEHVPSGVTVAGLRLLSPRAIYPRLGCRLAKRYDQQSADQAVLVPTVGSCEQLPILSRMEARASIVHLRAVLAAPKNAMRSDVDQ